MATENVAVVQRCIEAINARDVETLRRASTADVEVRPLRTALEGTVYRGHAGIGQWLHDLDESWAQLTIAIEAIDEPRPDAVIAHATLRARGTGSEAPTSMPVALVAQMRDGQVAEATLHLDADEARRAVLAA